MIGNRSIGAPLILTADCVYLIEIELLTQVHKYSI